MGAYFERNGITMSELPPFNETRPANRSGAWVAPVVLIGLGVIFLLQNFGYLYLHNWWALFILLGTVGAWGTAWRIYQSNGQRVTSQVTGAFIGGLFPLAVALIFLFDWNWGTLWPIFLIILGIAILVRPMTHSN